MSARNPLIAKIHVAKKQLALTDESYRDVLRKITGKESSSKMSDYELKAVIEEFNRLGFDGKHRPVKSGQRKMAKGSQAKMIRGLWLQLRDLGVLKNSSEEALLGYVKRMTDVDDLQWITPGDAGIVINGLRRWIEREGGCVERY